MSQNEGLSAALLGKKDYFQFSVSFIGDKNTTPMDQKVHC